MAKADSKKTGRGFWGSIATLAYNTIRHPFVSLDLTEDKQSPAKSLVSSVVGTITGGITFLGGFAFTMTGHPYAGILLMLATVQATAAGANFVQAAWDGPKKATQNIADAVGETRRSQPIFKRVGLSISNRLSTSKDKDGVRHAVGFGAARAELMRAFDGNEYLVDATLRNMSKRQIQTDREIQKDITKGRPGFLRRLWRQADSPNDNYTVEDAISVGKRIKDKLDKFESEPQGWAFFPGNDTPTTKFKAALRKFINDEFGSELKPHGKMPSEQVKRGKEELQKLYLDKIKTYLEKGKDADGYTYYTTEKLIETISAWPKPQVKPERYKSKLTGKYKINNDDWKYIRSDGSVYPDDTVFVKSKVNGQPRYIPRVRDLIQDTIKEMFNDMGTVNILQEKGIDDKYLKDPKKLEQLTNILAQAAINNKLFFPYVPVPSWMEKRNPEQILYSDVSDALKDRTKFDGFALLLAEGIAKNKAEVAGRGA